MSDDRLRRLEHAWRTSGAPDDEAALVLERLRVGLVARERVVLAATLGHPAALLVADGAPLETAIRLVGEAGALRVTIGAAAALHAKRSTSRSSPRTMTEQLDALRAARDVAIEPSNETVGRARSAVLALEASMGWAGYFGADPADEQDTLLWPIPGRTIADATAACAILAARIAVRCGSKPRESSLPLERLAAGHALKAIELVTRRMDRADVLRSVSDFLVPWALGHEDSLRTWDPALATPERPSRTRATPEERLRDLLRAVVAVPTSRFTAAEARDKPLWWTSDYESCTTAAEFGARVLLVLKRQNGNFQEGTLGLGHVACVIENLRMLRHKEGLAWFWIDADEIAAAPPPSVTRRGRATLALVVHDLAADEVLVTAYHRPRSGERTNVWSYSTGGSPDRLALSIRSRASAIREWSQVPPVACASTAVAQSWASTTRPLPGEP